MKNCWKSANMTYTGFTELEQPNLATTHKITKILSRTTKEIHCKVYELLGFPGSDSILLYNFHIFCVNLVTCCTIRTC